MTKKEGHEFTRRLNFMKRSSLTFLILTYILLIGCTENKKDSIPSGDKYEDYQKNFIGDKFASIFKLEPLFDFESAVDVALDENKPILLFFATIYDSGAGIRENIMKPLASKKAIDFIKDNYVLTILLTDIMFRKNKEDSLFIGAINKDIAFGLGYAIPPPFYLIVDSKGKHACSSYEKIRVADFEKFYTFLKENTNCQ